MFPGLLRIVGLPLALLVALSASGATVSGVVFHDRNANRQRDPGERGLPGVRVSNQRDIVTTDAQGRWTLPVLDEGETAFFVIKPRGWMSPVDERQLPRFFHLHKPAGSPKMKYNGLPASGDPPWSIDFPLIQQEEPEAFQAVFFGDTQPRDLREVEYIAHDTVEELIGTRARFGVTLGDIVFDDLSVMEPLAATVALIGVPWWNVIGNHDVNGDAPDALSFDDTYNRVYGPSYFAFDYGPVHFIALNNIQWIPPADRGTSKATWKPAIDARQLEWLERDLQGVPRETLVMLMMHVPLNDLTNRLDVYRLIESRPYCLSIAGHTHWHEHRFLTAADGWKGASPHHHIVNVTVCGSWFTGQPDEWGIPHATMSDGAPNGYTLLTFKDRKVTIDFKASRRPAEHQMSLFAPESIEAREAGSTNLYANVFNAPADARVEFRVDEVTPWIEMKRVLEPDPHYVATRAREPEKPALPWRALGGAMKSPHLWKAPLPATLSPGVRRLQVRARDVNGRWVEGERAITIR